MSRSPQDPVDWESQLVRSLLFVPGSDERKLEKVASFGADAVVIDLEDAVADEEKSAARAVTREAIPRAGAAGAVVIVRVNSIATGRMEEDVATVVRPELAGIMVPKLEDAETLPAVDAALADAEREQGIDVGTIRVLALIETPRGLVECERILAGAPARTLTAVFGAGDFTTELGVDLTRDAAELQYARSRLVVATRAAGMTKPIDGPWLALEDLDGLAADCARSRGLGFQGRVTVYPPQVATVHHEYSWLPDEEVQRARRVVEAFEAAEAEGVASIRVDGRFVDYPIYRLALERLRLAGAHEAGARA
jgi:citrate lyase subunit beta/citryl-CoA lyase